MVRIPRARAVALALSAVGLFVGVSSLTSTPACSTPSGAPAAAPAPIIIGASLSLTNGLSGSAQPLKNAILAAQGQINATGGLLGRPVQFLIKDDQSDETPGGIVTNTAESLVEAGAVAFLGPVGSSQVLAMDQVTYGSQIIQIVSNATSPDLVDAQPTDGGRYLFRTTPADDLQARAVVKFAMEGPAGVGGDAGSATACTRMAIFHINNSYGTAMSQVIQQYFPTKLPSVVIHDISVDVNAAASYAAQVADIAAFTPDCLAIITYEPNADQFMFDFTSYKTAHPTAFPASFFIIGTDGIYTSEFLDDGRQNQSDPTSPTVAEGIYGTNPDTNPPTSEYGEFRTIYQAYFPGVEPEPFTANMYDAAILTALAIEQAGSLTNHAKIRDSLFAVANPPGSVFTPGQLGEALQAIRNGTDINYKGASGDVDIDINGNVISNYIIWKVVNGQFTTIGRIDATDL